MSNNSSDERLLQGVPSPASDFNGDLLSGIVLAWSEASDYLRDMLRQVTPAGRLTADQLYAIIPRADTIAADLAPAQNDAWLSKTISSEVTTAIHPSILASLSNSHFTLLRVPPCCPAAGAFVAWLVPSLYGNSSETCLHRSLPNYYIALW